MSDVPKFLRQRAAQQATGDHPDANLLAALAEGGLTKGERAHVLAHLGTCAACRDVLALALHASPDAASAPAPAERSWLRWPMLRWAGATAAVVVVAAAVMLMKPHQQATMPVPQREVEVDADKPAARKAPKATEAPSASAAANVGPPETADSARRKDSASARVAREESKAKAFKKEDAVRGQLRANDALESREADRVAKTNEGASQVAAEPGQQVPAQAAPTHAQAPAAPPPGYGQVAGLAAQSSQSAAQQSPRTLRDQAVQAETQSQATGGPRAKQQVQQAQQAAASSDVTAAPAVAMNKAGRAPMATVKMSAIIPRWRVSAQGEVERSLDAGRSWHAVAVATRSVSFRSVSAVDHDVWAGGAGGALYHSADDGRTWTPVTVKALDMVLATEIARVEFTDALHGTVITATGVTWTTADAGLTWSLRAKPAR